MKKIFKNKYVVVLIIFTLIFTFLPNVLDAASFSAGASKSTLYIGESTNITISTSECAGQFSVSSSNPSVATVSTASIWADGTATISVNAKAVGTANIIIKAEDVSDKALNDVTGTKTISIIVKQKSTANNNNNNSNSNKNNNNNTSGNKNTTTNNSTSTKSSNNYLKSLQVSEEGLTPDFVKTKTNYTLSVGEKVTKLDVRAVAEDAKAKVTISGNEELKDGDNNITITVVAENGSKRTYTITVNKSADAVKSNSYLSNLIIRDMTLTPEFSTEVLEYDGGIIKTNDTKLDIYAYPTNENAKVEIIGNENLSLGENTITIKITSEDGTSTKEYVIKFIREEGEVVDALAEVEDNNSSTPKGGIKNFFKEIWQTIKANGLILLMYLLIIVEYIQIIYLYKKLRQKNAQEDKDKSSFDQYNIKLDEDKKRDFKLIENNLEEREESSLLDNEPETIEENIEEKNEEIEEVEKKVKSIWDEERPNFLEEEDITEENGKRRRGR